MKAPIYLSVGCLVVLLRHSGEGGGQDGHLTTSTTKAQPICGGVKNEGTVVGAVQERARRCA
jgi:hypothetical protein